MNKKRILDTALNEVFNRIPDMSGKELNDLIKTLAPMVAEETEPEVPQKLDLSFLQINAIDNNAAV